MGDESNEDLAHLHVDELGTGAALVGHLTLDLRHAKGAPAMNHPPLPSHRPPRRPDALLTPEEVSEILGGGPPATLSGGAPHE